VCKWCRPKLVNTLEKNIGDHSENSNSRNISATERPILTIFSTMMSLGLPDTVCQWNFTNLKTQDGGDRDVEKLKLTGRPIAGGDWRRPPSLNIEKILIYLRNRWPILMKLGMLLRLNPLHPIIAIAKSKSRSSRCLRTSPKFNFLSLGWPPNEYWNNHPHQYVYTKSIK